MFDSEIPTLKTIAVEPDIVQAPTVKVAEKSAPPVIVSFAESKKPSTKPSRKLLPIGFISGCMLCAVGLLCAFLWFAKTPSPVIVSKPISPVPALKVEQKTEMPKVEQATKVEPAKVEATAEVVAEKPAQIRLSIRPWGEVFVNGESRGVSPPSKSLILAAGDYSVEIRNGDYPVHKVSVKLNAGEIFKLNHAFVDTVQKQ